MRGSPIRAGTTLGPPARKGPIMALSAFPHTDALVRVQVSTLPRELRVLAAESAVEAATQIWAMRARSFDSNPTGQALRLAQWAAEDMRDAQDALEAARA